MLKSTRIYIKLTKDKVEATNLETGETISMRAINSFSSKRNIVGNFNNAYATVQAALKELGVKRNLFGSNLKVLIQQLEGTEGGLSDIEKRALHDIGEMVGGKKIVIVEHSKAMTENNALLALASK